MSILDNYFIILHIMPFTIFFTLIIYILFLLIAFNKFKNQVLKTPNLKTGSYIIINSIFTI